MNVDGINKIPQTNTEHSTFKLDIEN